MEVINPPKDENKFAETGKWLVDSAHELGMDIDTEGFLYSWVAGTRVLVEKDGDKVVGMALMAVGFRWVDSSYKATLLRIAGNEERLMEFARTIAKATGATGLLYEEDDPLEATDEYTRYVIREENLE